MKRLSLRRKILISIVTILIDLYCLFIFSNNYNSVYYPSTSRVDLQMLLNKDQLTPHDYLQLYYQTGLGKPAVDALIKTADGKNRILEFQENYFRKSKITSKKINPFTSQESIQLTSNHLTNKSWLAPVKNGDILLTKSTQTLFWRHGHCGIVIDAEKGITLESLEPGSFSMIQDISRWHTYPTLKILRLKNTDDKVLNQIANYAKSNLLGLEYSILAMKCYNKDIPKNVNCSQIIWQAYNYFGYDLDSNKGIIVTPEDIAKSPLLEVIQVKGFNPDKAW